MIRTFPGSSRAASFPSLRPTYPDWTLLSTHLPMMSKSSQTLDNPKQTMYAWSVTQRSSLDLLSRTNAVKKPFIEVIPDPDVGPRDSIGIGSHLKVGTVPRNSHLQKIGMNRLTSSGRDPSHGSVIVLRFLFPLNSRTRYNPNTVITNRI